VSAKPRRVGRAVIPRATYRLQLHKGFDFNAARAVLPYLQRLGVSHVYCSPISTARPGSLHGYDVVDHGRINPELGGPEGFERFAREAREHGLGLLIDIVPNHMGVFGADNPWWLDVLENGQASEYAPCFDIDWRPPNPAMRGRVLVPLLGDHFGAILDRGELQLGFDPQRGGFALHYHQHLCPLDPRTYPTVLLTAVTFLAPDDAGLAPLVALSAAFGELPLRDDLDGVTAATRRQHQRDLQRRLSELVVAQPGVAAAIAVALDQLNAAPGHDVLDEIHAAQAYRLAYWRIASGEINYRRFFDVNDLAAIRIEDERVFEATQGPALDLAARGLVDGLRIDHPDGLRDPAAYFARLQAGYARRAGIDRSDADPQALDLYVVGEKIAAFYENLPPSWQIHGTTGYRFAMVVNGLFVERRSARALQRLWRECGGSARSFATIKFECKRRIATGPLRSELNVLGNSLQKIAQADRRTRDYSLADLSDALADVAASMPVYRTYVVDVASEQDRRFIDWAVAQARQRTELPDPGIFDFVRRCLLAEPAAIAPGDPPALAYDDGARRFAARFQQFCAPVAAKGVEDTAFYRFYRLVSLNEVGADPEVFGIGARAFHGANADRAARWPHTMLATSTHDNKRAEDVRSRINVLSERPAFLRVAVRRWRKLVRPFLSDPAPGSDGDPIPTPADQYLLLQTLLGTLPASSHGADELANYRERIEQYMLKAAREAKLETSWNRPNADYEAALVGLVRGVLAHDTSPGMSFLRTRVTAIAWFGFLSSLSVTVLKLTVPGVPDIYQGTELIDLSLVDPDNRREVAFDLRDRLLAGFESAWPHGGEVDTAMLVQLVTEATDGDGGGLKLWATWRLLALRREQPELFSAGKYFELHARGPRRAHVLAFARRHGRWTLVVIVGRKFALLDKSQTLRLDPAGWSGTLVPRPGWIEAGTLALDVLTGRRSAAGRDGIDVQAAFLHLPVAAWLFDAEAPGAPVPAPEA
jgi:(1->4)-alpha-D-glucan 1-alpha-D-glucosylmutase